MRIDILSIFPEFFNQTLKHSIIKRSIEKEKVEIYIHNIRDFSKNKQKSVDDYLGFVGNAEKICKRARNHNNFGSNWREQWDNRRREEIQLAHKMGLMSDLDKAIKIDPSHWASFRHRSIIHHMLGNNDESYGDYIKSKNIESDK